MSDLSGKLFRLDTLLRQSGFTASPAQLIESRQLLEALARQSIDTANAAEVAGFLGPIYCASEAQQQDFPALLARAWAQEGAEPPPTPPSSGPVGSGRLRWLRPVAAGVAVLGLGALIALVYHAQPEPPASPLAAHVSLGDEPCPSCSVRVQRTGPNARSRPGQQLGQQLTGANGDVSVPVRARDLPVILTADSPCEGVDPVSTAPIEHLDGRTQTLALKPCRPPPTPAAAPTPTGGWQQVFSTPQPGMRSVVLHSRTQLSAARTLGVLWPLGLAALWWLYCTFVSSAWLQRLPQRTARNIRELSVGARHSLAGALGWRQMGHELRRREWVASGILDVEATLDTVLASSNPRLVFGSRVEPEYLALIEESTPGDHLARFGEELLLALEHRDVGLRRYYFKDSPARCAGPAMPRRPRGAGLTGIVLDELLARHPDHRLLIISDGRCLFDRITGQPHTWTQQLARARQPALLTPLPRAAWGRREWALGRLGVAVLPLTSQGVERLSETYLNEGPHPGHVPPVNPPLPRWMAEPWSMLLAAPPARLSAGALREQLEARLEAPAYQLAQGAAAYPQIHWGLTTRLGARLLSKTELAEALPRLAVLPWFRQGYMPQWLRAELTGAQTRSSWQKLHRAVTSLLETARQDAKGPVPLRIVTGTRPYWRQVAELLRHPVAWLGRSRSEPAPLRRDAVFLRFLQGPHRLSVRAGELLRRALFAGAAGSQGARALPILVLALLAAGVLAWQRPPVSTEAVTVPGASQITALALVPGEDQAGTADGRAPLPTLESTALHGPPPSTSDRADPKAHAAASPSSPGTGGMSIPVPMRIVAGYSSGQVWMLGAQRLAPLAIPPLVQGIAGLTAQADGSLEVTEVGGRVLDVTLRPLRELLIMSAVSAAQPQDSLVGRSSYVVTADGSRYYVGAVLPQGGKLAGVQADGMLIERNGKTEHLKLTDAQASAAVLRDGYSPYPVLISSTGRLQIKMTGPDRGLAPSVPQPGVVDIAGKTLCAGSIEASAQGSPAARSLLAVQSKGSPGAGTEVVSFGAALKASPFMSGPPGVAFDGCRIEARFIVAWRASAQREEVWRAVIEAPGEGFSRMLTADSAKGAITDALLSDNERSLFVQRTGGIEVYGPQGRRQGEVPVPAGALFSVSADGQQLAVAAGGTVSLWRSSPVPNAAQEHTLLAVAASETKPEDAHAFQKQLLAAGFPDAQVFLTPTDNRYAVSLGQYANDAGEQAIARFKAMPPFNKSLANEAKLVEPNAAWISVWPAAVLPRDCPECPEVVVVPPGSFQMGSPASESGREDDEGPVHTVTIGYPLAVSKYPITRGEWRRYLQETGQKGSNNCIGYNQAERSFEHKQEYNWLNPGFKQQDTHPVVCLKWQEAQDYAAWLSKKTAHHYRLLSEAEYEYLERAGSQSPFPWDDRTSDAQCEHANAADATLKAGHGQPYVTYASCSDGFEFTSPVDHFPANAFGLYDIDGNVLSWVQDCYHQGGYQGAPADGNAWHSPKCDVRVFRGGSWYNSPRSLRSANRAGLELDNSHVGFRVARTLCAISPDGRSPC